MESILFLVDVLGFLLSVETDVRLRVFVLNHRKNGYARMAEKIPTDQKPKKKKKWSTMPFKWHGMARPTLLCQIKNPRRKIRPVRNFLKTTRPQTQLKGQPEPVNPSFVTYRHAY